MKTKKLLSFLLLSAFSLQLISCGDNKNIESKVESEASKVEQLIPSERAAFIWKSDWADEANGIADASTVYGFDYYKNGVISEDEKAGVGDSDAKYLFYGEKNTRVVNFADGYQFTLPYNKFDTDYSLSALRSRYMNDNFVLTVTREEKNPYGNNANGWKTYYDEWLARYLENLDFLTANGIRRSRAKQESTDLIEGYTVTMFNMQFNRPIEYKYKYYDIAIVRPTNEYVKFYLFVMKSTDKQIDKFDAMIKSFKEFEKQGTAKNTQGAYELKIPDYWSQETKDYYNQLKNQTNVSWGAFSASMPEDEDTAECDKKLEFIKQDQARLETAFDYKFDIMPTYTPISWGENFIDFPSRLAGELAGGNGFNGKPVLQFTYQFTTLNNTNLAGYTPMFDILNGKYDAQFKKIAQSIKAYGKPVLFRLNNEMNTDWTSYCGMLSLLDPDVFVYTWQRLYNIFIEEKVDNCIWIFNPIAKSCPYSNWGDYLCYMPGTDYMQLMGLTYYEMNNDQGPVSFSIMYKELYAKNMPYFKDYPWIISEFGCGSGGEVYYDWGQKKYLTVDKARNKVSQAQWVKEMFECFNNNQDEAYAFCKNIKAAVWFSVNDYAEVDKEYKIINYLQLNDELTETLAEFKTGLAGNKN